MLQAVDPAREYVPLGQGLPARDRDAGKQKYPATQVDSGVTHWDSVTSCVKSRDMVENQEGRSPFSWLRQRVRDSRPVYAVISRGRVPDSWLPVSLGKVVYGGGGATSQR